MYSVSTKVEWKEVTIKDWDNANRLRLMDQPHAQQLAAAMISWLSLTHQGVFVLTDTHTNSLKSTFLKEHIVPCA